MKSIEELVEGVDWDKFKKTLEPLKKFNEIRDKIEEDYNIVGGVYEHRRRKEEDNNK